MLVSTSLASRPAAGTAPGAQAHRWTVPVLATVTILAATRQPRNLPTGSSAPTPNPPAEARSLPPPLPLQSGICRRAAAAVSEAGGAHEHRVIIFYYFFTVIVHFDDALVVYLLRLLNDDHGEN